MNERLFKFYTYAVTLFWGTVVWIIIISSVGGVVSPLTEKQKQAVSFLFPEGWGFFTKNPRAETLIDIYRINPAGLQLANITNTSLENILGLSRKSRFIGAEYSKLVVTINQQIASKSWTVVENWNESKGPPNKVFKVNSKLHYKYLKSGDYLIVKHKIIPWAWARRGQDTYNKHWLLRISL